MSLQIKVKVKRVEPLYERGKYKATPVVVETIEQYPKEICLDAAGDKAEPAQKLKEGQEITVFINLESRKHNDKWYHNVKLWKWENA